jgi:hypothetical protein
MTKNNGNGNHHDPNGFLSGPNALLELMHESQLNALGGQDLRKSGFDNEEPDPEFSRRDEQWQA